MMKSLNIFIMIALCTYLQIEKAQANNFLTLLSSDNNVDSKIKAVDEYPAFDFDPNRHLMYRQMEELRISINNGDVILDGDSVDALAIALKRGRYNAADALVGLFLETRINMASYRTNNRLQSIYPQDTTLSEIIDCRVKLHTDYLENNEFISERQRFLLESAIQSLRGLHTEIYYLEDLPTLSLNRCDAILNNRIFIDKAIEWFESLTFVEWMGGFVNNQ